MRLGFLFGMGGVSGQEREIPRGGEKTTLGTPPRCIGRSAGFSWQPPFFFFIHFSNCG